MRGALPAGFAVLGALWPCFAWIIALNGKVEATSDSQFFQEKRIERAEKLNSEEMREVRVFLESVDRRLSRIEGRLGPRK